MSRSRAEEAHREPFLLLAAIARRPTAWPLQLAGSVVAQPAAASRPRISARSVPISSLSSRSAASRGLSPSSMPPCGICQASGVSMRRPTKTRPSRVEQHDADAARDSAASSLIVAAAGAGRFWRSATRGRRREREPFSSSVGGPGDDALDRHRIERAEAERRAVLRRHRLRARPAPGRSRPRSASPSTVLSATAQAMPRSRAERAGDARRRGVVVDEQQAALLQLARAPARGSPLGRRSGRP